MMKVVLSNEQHKLDLFEKVLFKGYSVDIEPSTLKKVEDSYNFLNEFSKDKLIYGITTGLGPMAQYRVKDEDRRKLQYNLIRSHAAGVGNHIDPICIKSAMLCRLINILNAKSGIHPECALLLRDFINNDIIPVVFEHGGVGASGDLVQLSHIALAMIGEGDVYFKNKIVSAADAMKQCGLKPIDIHIREGLSLINGTSVMTGIAIVNLINAINLFNWSVMSTSFINEIVESYSDGFSVELNAVKKHDGQHKVAEMIRKYLAGSKRIKDRSHTLFNHVVTEDVLKEKVQEYYSIRCAPQILGPILDTIEYSKRIIMEEVNSVNDNPIVDMEHNNVFHGGNFHGDYISLEMDKLKIVMTKLTMTNERQLNYLYNPNLNQLFPPFVNLGVKGLNLGMQGAQFPATSTTAECQTLCFPNYVHSIPNNNDNQDIVSMGTNSALITKRVIENSYQVLSIYYISILQGIDYLHDVDSMSDATKKIYSILRNIVPVFIEDTPKYKEIAEVTDFIQGHGIEEII